MSAVDRLARLLALLPWLAARPGVSQEEAAAAFGLTREQLVQDLETLFMCGLPGYGPGDLIEVSFEGDDVVVTDDAGLSRPLRLSAEEATALLVALRTLAALPGTGEGTAIQSALATLERAAGGAAPASVRVELEAAPGVAALVDDALARGRRLHLRYHVESRDETTERDVDPMRVLGLGGFVYLEGYCRAVEDVRLFRLDRVLAAEVLDVAAEVPPEARPRDVGPVAWAPAAEDPVVELLLAPSAAWVADHYPCESDEPDGEGRRVRLRVSDDGWLRRLVLRAGGGVRPLAPASLVEACRADVEAALARQADA